ncbi:MAG: hypothetical protein V3T08_07905 [Gemmatimonadota bacterium]
MTDRQAVPSLGIKLVCFAGLIGAVGSCEPASEEVKVGQVG